MLSVKVSDEIEVCFRPILKGVANQIFIAPGRFDPAQTFCVRLATYQVDTNFLATPRMLDFNLVPEAVLLKLNRFVRAMVAKI